MRAQERPSGQQQAALTDLSGALFKAAEYGDARYSAAVRMSCPCGRMQGDTKFEPTLTRT